MISQRDDFGFGLTTVNWKLLQARMWLRYDHVFLQDATINGSEENLSVYELVERGNASDAPELRQSGTLFQFYTYMFNYKNIRLQNT